MHKRSLFPRFRQQIQKPKKQIKNCAKKLGGGGGVKDSFLIVGPRLVSGKYHEPEEPYGVSKGQNPPCFCGHFFDWGEIGALSPVIV